MEYKGYIGSVEFSEPDGVFFGKVQGIRSLISYEGTTAKELVDDFHGSVDDYLAACESAGAAPEQAYKGSLNIRLGGDLHRKAAMYAISHQQSLNSFIEDAVREKLGKLEPVKKSVFDMTSSEFEEACRKAVANRDKII